MSHRKKPERRTFLQDRFDILIKKQKKGEANFNELTELDAIVNSDPDIRKRIIMENMLMDYSDDFITPSDNPELKNVNEVRLAGNATFLNRLISLAARIFNLKFFGLTGRRFLYGTKLYIIH